MEFTAEHYRSGKIAYEGYIKQSGGKSLATGDTLPPFDELKHSIQDAWAAAAIALLLDRSMSIRKNKDRHVVRIAAAIHHAREGRAGVETPDSLDHVPDGVRAAVMKDAEAAYSALVRGTEA